MKLLEIVEEQYHIYVDMDGVLADFQRKMSKLMGEPHDEARYDTDKKYRNQMWKAFHAHRKQGGEVWYELHPMPDMPQLWSYIKKYNPEILSAAGQSNLNGKDQKERWVQKHLGSSVKVNIVQGAADKQQFAGPNHILIDDKEKALRPWVAAGGIGILHTSAANTIQQLRKMGL